MRKLDKTPKTLGEKLRALRRGQAVSLDMVEARTHIQRRYLLALESGRYDDLPAPMYTRNFIRAYARELHADENYFIELYEEECGRCDLVDPMRLPRQRVRRMRFFIWNRVVKVSLFASVMLAIFGYLGWQIQSLIAPPQVVIFNPSDEFTTPEAIIIVEGVVEEEASVYVNGEEVVVNEDRTFRTPVDLERGLNVISIEAQRRYSKRSLIERRVLFNPSELTLDK